MNNQFDIKYMIGRTPMVKISHLENNIYIKLESFNIGGSIKDRAVLRIITDAENSGILLKGNTLVEASSGNTGIAAALIGRQKGYKIKIITHDKISREKMALLKYYGANVTVVDSKLEAHSEGHYVNVAKNIALQKDHYFLNQFANKSNILSHIETTGPEIWKQTEGEIDTFICGIGSGGTITGVSKYLKTKNKNMITIAADPEGSIYYQTFYKKEPIKKSSSIEGIGSNFIPEILDLKLVDEMISVSDESAVSACYYANKNYGLSIGLSSGAAFHVALKYSETVKNSNIVMISADSSERYLSKIATFNTIFMEH
jgi:cystathionine beta-synthase